MPSVSKKQHNAMEAAAHGTSTLGIPKSVGQEFAAADKGRSFADGGPVGMGISPAAGTSATLPPPPGQRTPSRRFYGKR